MNNNLNAFEVAQYSCRRRAKWPRARALGLGPVLAPVWNPGPGLVPLCTPPEGLLTTLRVFHSFCI